MTARCAVAFALSNAAADVSSSDRFRHDDANPRLAQFCVAAQQIRHPVSGD